MAGREIPFFHRLATDRRISLSHARSLDPAKRRDELQYLQSFFGRMPQDLVHFACHAYYQTDAPFDSYFKLSDEFLLSLQDMDVYAIGDGGHPLVVLNACETGNLNPLYTRDFAKLFIKRGARAVVATECALPDDFGSAFAEQLYTHLLAGRQLGESLLESRKHFVEVERNPSGLLYSLYGDPSVRIEQQR